MRSAQHESRRRQWPTERLGLPDPWSIGGGRNCKLQTTGQGLMLLSAAVQGNDAVLVTLFAPLVDARKSRPRCSPHTAIMDVVAIG